MLLSLWRCSPPGRVQEIPVLRVEHRGGEGEDYLLFIYGPFVAVVSGLPWGWPQDIVPGFHLPGAVQLVPSARRRRLELAGHREWRLPSGAVPSDAEGKGWLLAAVWESARVCFAVPAPTGPMVAEAAAAAGVLWTVLAGGVVLHASSVVVGESLVLFSGPSGIGKTTAATLLAGDDYFTADQVVCLPSETGWLGYRLRDTRAPSFGIGAICFLERAEATVSRRLTHAESVRRTMANLFLPPGNDEMAHRVLDNAVALSSAVAAFRLGVSLSDFSLSAVESLL